MGILNSIQAALKGKPKTEDQLRIEKEEQERRKLEADEYRRQAHEANMKQTKVRATREAATRAAAPPPRSIQEKAWNFMTTAPTNNPFASEMGGSPRPGKRGRSSRKEASPFSGEMSGGFGGGFGGGESNPFSEHKPHTGKKSHKRKGKSITINLR